MIELRWATAEDIARYYGKPPAFSMQAIVALEDGEPVGLGGVYYQGGAVVAFSDTKKAIDRRTIVKGLRMFRGMLERKPCRVIALPAPDLQTAPGFLRHCGFAPLTGTVYSYEG